MSEAALRLLRGRGAGTIEHPGGTLLDHLVRVAERLASYGAAPALVAAGLTHAAYSTDGFDTALLEPSERDLLRAVVGTEAEQIVYRFGATERRPFYRQLDQPLVVWTDRFTGAALTLDPADVAPLVELTVANELDVLAHSTEVAADFGPSLLALFTRARPSMTAAAWADVQRALDDSGRPG